MLYISGCAMATNMGQTPTARGILHLKNRSASEAKQFSTTYALNARSPQYRLKVGLCCTDNVLMLIALSLLRHFPSNLVRQGIHLAAAFCPMFRAVAQWQLESDKYKYF